MLVKYRDWEIPLTAELNGPNISCFAVDREGKFCYDGVYSNIENHLLIEMYLVKSCEKGECPHAKETDYLHE